MPKLLVAESTLTDRYQTTIPETIREALHLSKRDKITYELADNGQVFITKTDQEDPILGEFISFLANDIKNNPSSIQTISSALRDRALSLVSEVKIDLDAPLSKKDD